LELIESYLMFGLFGPKGISPQCPSPSVSHFSCLSRSSSVLLIDFVERN